MAYSPSFGTFSTNLNPIYSFGVPRQVKMSGIMVDMDAVANSLWAKNNDAQLTLATGQQIGMMTSAWEHKIPEMLFTNEEYPGEAVSAVKALAIASAEGQRIYHVTKENVDAVLPVLNIGSEVKNEIRNSVSVGKVATVSQSTITVGSWTGVGYIIADLETGAGAYRISGGSDGAILIVTGIAMMLLTLFLTSFSFPFLVAFLFLGFLTYMIGVLVLASGNLHEGWDVLGAFLGWVITVGLVFVAGPITWPVIVATVLAFLSIIIITIFINFMNEQFPPTSHIKWQQQKKVYASMKIRSSVL